MEMNNPLPILGFGLSSYRSFGPERQRIGPCGKINLIAGQNNSGKSNILRFVQDHYPSLNALARGGRCVLKELEIHRSAQTSPIHRSFALPWSDNTLQAILGKVAPEKQREVTNSLTHLTKALLIDPCGSGFWVHFTVSGDAQCAEFSEDLIGALARDSNITSACNQLMYGVRGQSFSPQARSVVEAAKWLVEQLWTAPKCVTIPSVRKPGASDTTQDDFSGGDIVHRLARVQNPDHDKQDLRNDFERIQGFLRNVTDRSDARLEVPYARNTITVHMDGRSMPLEALGTGVHEVIMIAAVVTTLHGNVICIEEPELHLHPVLQKKLLKYLQDYTDNQYFISTHSGHFLDHAGAAIFHVRLEKGVSVVSAASEPCQRFAVCKDLGYRASDLLQTNCIIWVEGPSDRIYLREWIRLCDDDLAEGIDYSIMFYGGRLLSHLSPNDPDVEEFISLRRVNRNMVIIMDSDKSKSTSPLNATKERILASWKDEPGFSWVTGGREIENYVPPESIVEGLNVCGGLTERKPSRYSRCIQFQKNGKGVDKIRLARWLVQEHRLSLKVLDLEAQIGKLCEFIRSSNS